MVVSPMALAITEGVCDRAKPLTSSPGSKRGRGRPGCCSSPLCSRGEATTAVIRSPPSRLCLFIFHHLSVAITWGARLFHPGFEALLAQPQQHLPLTNLFPSSLSLFKSATLHVLADTEELILHLQLPQGQNVTVGLGVQPGDRGCAQLVRGPGFNSWRANKANS